MDQKWPLMQFHRAGLITRDRGLHTRTRAILYYSLKNKRWMTQVLSLAARSTPVNLNKENVWYYQPKINIASSVHLMADLLLPCWLYKLSLSSRVQLTAIFYTRQVISVLQHLPPTHLSSDRGGEATPPPSLSCSQHPPHIHHMFLSSLVFLFILWLRHAHMEPK